MSSDDLAEGTPDRLNSEYPKQRDMELVIGAGAAAIEIGFAVYPDWQISKSVIWFNLPYREALLSTFGAVKSRGNGRINWSRNSCILNRFSQIQKQKKEYML